MTRRRVPTPGLFVVDYRDQTVTCQRCLRTFSLDAAVTTHRCDADTNPGAVRAMRGAGGSARTMLTDPLWKKEP